MKDINTTVNTGFHERLLDDALAVDGLVTDSRLCIDNILSGQTYYRKSSFDEPLSDLSYYLSILDSGASGFAYHNGEPTQGDTVKRLVNRNALEVLMDETRLEFPLRVSLLDAIHGEINQLQDKNPDHSHVKDGTYQQKADFRSQLVTERLSPGGQVLLVGMVTEFVRDMIAKDIDVVISDMSPELRGKKAHGVPVINEGNEWTLKQLAVSDAAIVTGATFSTNTVDSILDIAREYDTELYFYLETGGNFAPYLINHGARSVIAERFPFYDLPGSSRFEVYEQ